MLGKAGGIPARMHDLLRKMLAGVAKHCQQKKNIPGKKKTDLITRSVCSLFGCFQLFFSPPLDMEVNR
jgi:hypothetical protein